MFHIKERDFGSLRERHRRLRERMRQRLEIEKTTDIQAAGSEPDLIYLITSYLIIFTALNINILTYHDI